MPTAYRFVGDTTEVFPWPVGQELEPGQEFESDAEIAHPRVERRAGDGWQPTISPAAEVGLPEKASELVALLADQPERADDVEAAESARPEPRKTVLEAVARAREGA